MINYEVKALGTDEDITVSHYVYVKKGVENKYWDFNTNGFKDFNDLNNGIVYLDELPNQKGLWEATLDIGQYTGSVKIIPRNGNTDVISGDVKRFYLVDGSPILDEERDKKMIHTDFGGFNMLRFVDDEGEPVEGATVRVWEKSAYESDNTDHPIGVTFTDKRGRWVNHIAVNTGFTYVVQFHKPGEFGPESVEVGVY